MSVSDLAIPQAQNAFALDFTVNGDGSCLAIGGSWNPGTSTCTMNGFTLNNGDMLTIDPSNTLSNTSTITIKSGATLTNLGNIVNSPAPTSITSVPSSQHSLSAPLRTKAQSPSTTFVK
jgi:hypothetical protein